MNAADKITTSSLADMTAVAFQRDDDFDLEKAKWKACVYTWNEKAPRPDGVKPGDYQMCDLRSPLPVATLNYGEEPLHLRVMSRETKQDSFRHWKEVTKSVKGLTVTILMTQLVGAAALRFWLYQVWLYELWLPFLGVPASLRVFWKLF